MNKRLYPALHLETN